MNNKLNAKSVANDLLANKNDYLSSKVAADIVSISDSIEGIMDEISSLENDVQIERDRLEKERLKKESQDIGDVKIEEN